MMFKQVKRQFVPIFTIHQYLHNIVRLKNLQKRSIQQVQMSRAAFIQKLTFILLVTSINCYFYTLCTKCFIFFSYT